MRSNDQIIAASVEKSDYVWPCVTSAELTLIDYPDVRQRREVRTDQWWFFNANFIIFHWLNSTNSDWLNSTISHWLFGREKETHILPRKIFFFLHLSKIWLIKQNRHHSTIWSKSCSRLQAIQLRHLLEKEINYIKWIRQQTLQAWWIAHHKWS